MGAGETHTSANGEGVLSPFWSHGWVKAGFPSLMAILFSLFILCVIFESFVVVVFNKRNLVDQYNIYFLLKNIL